MLTQYHVGLARTRNSTKSPLDCPIGAMNRPLDLDTYINDISSIEDSSRLA